MNRPSTDSDPHLMEVLEASKANLNALNTEIQYAKQDNEAYQKMVEQEEQEAADVENKTNELKEELKQAQDKNKDLAGQAMDLKSAINRSKQDLAIIIEEGEQKYKESAGQIKKAQEEQKKIQLQYKELQKENDKLENDKEKIARLQASLERKHAEIEAYKRELEEHQEKDNNRMHDLEENAKIMKDLSGSPS